MREGRRLESGVSARRKSLESSFPAGRSGGFGVCGVCAVQHEAKGRVVEGGCGRA